MKEILIYTLEFPNQLSGDQSIITTLWGQEVGALFLNIVRKFYKFLEKYRDFQNIIVKVKMSEYQTGLHITSLIQINDRRREIYLLIQFICHPSHPMMTLGERDRIFQSLNFQM